LSENVPIKNNVLVQRTALLYSAPMGLATEGSEKKAREKNRNNGPQHRSKRNMVRFCFFFAETFRSFFFLRHFGR